jgi:HEAT repeat protein
MKRIKVLTAISFVFYLSLSMVLSAEESSEQESSWENTIAYGIDSEVVALLQTLSEREDVSLKNQLIERYDMSRNIKLREEIFNFFREQELNGLEEQALEILRYFYEYDNSLVRAAIRYTATIETLNERNEILDLLFDLIKEDEIAYSSYAVETVGELGEAQDAERLLEILEDSDDISESLKEHILLALGKIASDVAVDTLIEILEDDLNSDIERNYAADALGKIGDSKAIPVLEEILGSDNNMLRAYAISALLQFPNYDSSQILRSALRDSFWRTREIAIDGIIQAHRTETVPALRYMARHDPEGKIRSKAIEALALLNTSEGWEFINEAMEDDDTPENTRLEMIQLAIEHNPEGSADILEGIIESEWEEEDSRLLDTIAKGMSTANNAAFKPFFRRFLEHPNFIIQIYGVRGIALNNIIQYRTQVEALGGEEAHPALQRAVRNALEEF